MTPALDSGFGGAIDGIAGVGQWDLSTTAELKAIAHSGTQGGTARVLGNDDWKGSYQAYGAIPTKMPWDVGTLTLSVDAAHGYAGSALITGVQINWDVEGGEPIEHTVQFEGNGAVTVGAAVAADSAVTIPVGCKSLKAALGTVVAEPVWTDFAIRTAQLSLNAPGQAGVDSGTVGVVQRKKGNLDATLTMSVYFSDPTALPAKGTEHAIRIYTASAAYWEIYWMILQEISGIVVDLKTKKLIGATLSFGWNCATTVGATATMGHIIKPSGASAWWPPAA